MRAGGICRARNSVISSNRRLLALSLRTDILFFGFDRYIRFQRIVVRIRNIFVPEPIAHLLSRLFSYLRCNTHCHSSEAEHQDSEVIRKPNYWDDVRNGIQWRDKIAKGGIDHRFVLCGTFWILKGII